MSELNTKEKAWLKKVQKVLKECPSERIGFYTIGDNYIHAFDVDKLGRVFDCMDSGKATDFGPATIGVGADFGESLWFPNSVESTAG